MCLQIRQGAFTSYYFFNDHKRAKEWQVPVLSLSSFSNNGNKEVLLSEGGPLIVAPPWLPPDAVFTVVLSDDVWDTVCALASV